MQTFGLRLLLRWRALHARHRFDVVFDNQCLSWGLLGIRAAGVPVVSVIHHPLHIDREADFAVDPRLVKKVKRTLYFPLWMQQQVAPRLDRIVTVSEASRAEIERYFGIPEKEIAVVYNGTDTELFRPVPGVAKETDLIFVGRTEDRKKGIGTLLEALSLLPERVRLKIVDGRIPENGLVPRLVRKFGLAGRVVFQPRFLELPELVREYSTGRVAVVPSFFEGFGFPASEAMACGLPVVANAAGALPEVVGSDGAAGLLVPPRDPRALAAALGDVLADPVRLERMGRAARARVETTFRWSEAAAQLARVLEETRRAAHRRPRAA
jgi:glycosyltransferase involved in cell wall biosynthesis